MILFAVHCLSLIGPARVVVEVGSGATAEGEETAAPTPVAESVFTVDRANEEWLEELVRNGNVESMSEAVVTILRRAASGAVDEKFVFEKKRGCGRKKEKRKVNLRVDERSAAYLERMVEAHALPDVGKALRIVLDWAMEDGGDLIGDLF